MKLSKSRAIVATLAIIAATAGMTTPAYAVEPSSGHPASVGSVVNHQLKYSDADVVDFLIFARGAIARDKPQLITTMNLRTVTDAPQSATTDALKDLLAVDPKFHENVTVKAQAGDPYLAQASLQAFAKDMYAVAAKNRVNTNAVNANSRVTPNFGWAYANWYVSVDNVVAVTVAVSVAGAALAFVVWLYQRPADSSAIADQRYAASWGSL